MAIETGWKGKLTKRHAGYSASTFRDDIDNPGQGQTGKQVRPGQPIREVCKDPCGFVLGPPKNSTMRERTQRLYSQTRSRNHLKASIIVVIRIIINCSRAFLNRSEVPRAPSPPLTLSFRPTRDRERLVVLVNQPTSPPTHSSSPYRERHRG